MSDKLDALTRATVEKLAHPRALGRSARHVVLTRGNLIAGIAVGSYLIPQAMAYGTLAGIGPAAGLSMALIPLLLYPLLGRSRFLSVGPESATALLAGVTVAPIALAHPGQEVQVMVTLTFLVGALMLAALVIRAGAIADLLSRPVLLGYMAGIAVLMAESQLPKLINGDIDTTSVITLANTLAGASVNWVNTIVATVTILIIVLARKVSPLLPGAPLALLLAGLLGAALGADTIGTVTSAVPTNWYLPDFSLVGELALPALAVMLVAYTDSVVSARAFAQRGDRLDTNRELAAWGSIGVVNSMTGAYPSSASSSRTAIAIASGATNRYYSWTVAFVAVILPLTISGALAHIPTAALAGIVLYAASHLVDIKSVRQVARFRFRELAITIITVIGVVTLGVLPGIGIAVALSIAELLLRLMRPHEGVLGFVPGMAGMHDIDDHEGASVIDGLVVYRYDAPLFFANSADFHKQVIDNVDAYPGTIEVILNMEANVEVDASGLDALETVHHELSERGIRLSLARVKNDLRIPLERYGLIDVIGEENIYPTLPTAVDAYLERTGQTRPGT